MNVVEEKSKLVWKNRSDSLFVFNTNNKSIDSYGNKSYYFSSTSLRSLIHKYKKDLITYQFIVKCLCNLFNIKNNQSTSKPNMEIDDNNNNSIKELFDILLIGYWDININTDETKIRKLVFHIMNYLYPDNKSKQDFINKITNNLAEKYYTILSKTEGIPLNKLHIDDNLKIGLLVLWTLEERKNSDLNLWKLMEYTLCLFYNQKLFVLEQINHYSTYQDLLGNNNINGLNLAEDIKNEFDIFEQKTPQWLNLLELNPVDNDEWRIYYLILKIFKSQEEFLIPNIQIDQSIALNLTSCFKNRGKIDSKHHDLVLNSYSKIIEHHDFDDHILTNKIIKNFNYFVINNKDIDILKKNNDIVYNYLGLVISFINNFKEYLIQIDKDFNSLDNNQKFVYVYYFSMIKYKINMINNIILTLNKIQEFDLNTTNQNIINQIKVYLLEYLANPLVKNQINNSKYDKLLNLVWKQYNQDFIIACIEYGLDSSLINKNLIDDYINLKNQYTIQHQEEYPEELLDPIAYTKISKPILLPGTDMLMDYDIIYRILKEKSVNPFTNLPLKLEDVIKYNSNLNVKRKIENIYQQYSYPVYLSDIEY